MNTISDADAETMMEPSQLSYSVRFYYAKENADDEVVLFVEHVIKNTGKSTQAFSLYGFGPFLSHIEPKRHLKSRTSPSFIHFAKRRPPVAEDVIRLAPGAEHKTQSWYWADETFPFVEDHGADMTIYEIPDNTELHVSLHYPLGVADNLLQQFLKPREHLVQGILGSKITRFTFRVLQPKDIESAP